jgi:hypothetical protein
MPESRSRYRYLHDVAPVSHGAHVRHFCRLSSNRNAHVWHPLSDDHVFGDSCGNIPLFVDQATEAGYTDASPPLTTTDSEHRSQISGPSESRVAVRSLHVVWIDFNHLHNTRTYFAHTYRCLASLKASNVLSRVSRRDFPHIDRSKRLLAVAELCNFFN